MNSLETDALIKCTQYSCFPYFKTNFKTLSMYLYMFLSIDRQVDKQIDPPSNNERNTNCESVSVISGIICDDKAQTQGQPIRGRLG